MPPATLVEEAPPPVQADIKSSATPRSGASESWLAATLASTALAACGGSDSDSDSQVGASRADSDRNAESSIDADSAAAHRQPTLRQAARFLAQASMGATREQIERVREVGYAAWLDEQFALPQEETRWDYLVRKGFDAESFRNGQGGFDSAMWKKLLSSPDTLRQRITFALSEILVTAIDGLVGQWRAFAACAYADLLELHAFGNYRTLLEEISTFPAMGQFLTFRANAKANPATGSMPDENYARELMQLFTIGLVNLNQDGTVQLVDGAPVETYGQDDITGLARVFTGWDHNRSAAVMAVSAQEYLRVPMTQVASRYETGAKTFLGTTIPAGVGAQSALTSALDTIFAHPNTAPFVSRQLIQRLVASNPSPAYVERVAAVFASSGSGVAGDMQAVIKAILLDVEARNLRRTDPTTSGKLREPIMRFTAWARAFGANSPSDNWAVGNTSDPATRFGQSPGRSPSVFNFFRPGYVPPNSELGRQGLVAPEFQITNESSVVGYVNFMQRMVSTGIGDVRADYAALTPLAADSRALVNEINLVLAARLKDATLASLATAVDTIAASSTTNRVYAALTLVLAAPEFIAQK